MDEYDVWFEEEHNTQPPELDTESLEKPSTDLTEDGFIILKVIS